MRWFSWARAAAWRFRAAAVGLGVACLAGSGCGTSRCQDQRCSRHLDEPDAHAPMVLGDAGFTTHLAEADAACAMQSVHAEHAARRPVDIIFVIDNSGSMSEEIAAVRRNIDHDFASIIEDSGVDYRVLMISRYGDDSTGVCLEPPLAGAGCGAGIAATNGARFFQYNQEIGSNDALCQILDTFDRPEGKRAPRGYQMWLRPEATKAFVVVTDDNARCTYHDDQIQLVVGADDSDPFTDALAFHAALRAKSPEQFGGQYKFFSIVGLRGASGPNPEPLFPYEPLDPKPCSTAPGAGLSYQALSIATDALRYPVCDGLSFDAVFHALAASVIKTSLAECSFELPVVPAPQTVLLSSVNLEYRTGDGATPDQFFQVQSPADCRDDHAFYIRDRIELCPRACQRLQQDKAPEVQILYGCAQAPE
jgi:hypothetical protein